MIPSENQENGFAVLNGKRHRRFERVMLALLSNEDRWRNFHVTYEIVVKE